MKKTVLLYREITTLYACLQSKVSFIENYRTILGIPEKGFHDQGIIPSTISCPMYNRMEFMPGKWRGLPDQNLNTSIRRYLNKK